MDRYRRRMKIASLLLATSLLTSIASPALAQPGPMPMPPPPVMIEPPRHRNPAMMIAGIVLTSIGSAALIGGVITTAAFSQASGEASGIGIVVIGLPLLGGSLLFAGVGVPLWVVGASAPPAHAALVPSLSVGAGSGTLRWTF